MNNIKINLIRTNDPTSIDPMLDEPQGLMYIAANLRKHGYNNVKITDLAGSGNNWYNKIDNNCDIYGIQLYTPTLHIGLEIANRTRILNHRALFICGGAHPSAGIDSKELMEYFDIVVAGEGEETMVDIVRQHEKNLLAEGEGIGWKHEFPKFMLGKSILNLDELPLPSWDMVDMMKFTRSVDENRSFGITGSRGCAFVCAFCDKSVFGKKVRWRSIDDIVLEVKMAIKNYGVKYFEFYDDMFVAKENRILEFIEKTKGLNIKFRCNMRTDSKIPDIYRLLKRAGCVSVAFGIESGSQRILDLMNKQSTVENNFTAIKKAQKAGLQTIGYFIIGFPGETKETIDKTLSFIENSNIDRPQVYQFTPLPGSPVFTNPDKYGIINMSKDWKQYWMVTGQNGLGGKVIDTKYMTSDELTEHMIEVRKFLRNYGIKGSTAKYYTQDLNYCER